jgi:nitrogen fixation NifU-like protein
LSEIYTQRLLDHVRHPRNRGRLGSPDLIGEEYNPLCGDRVRIEAQIEGDRIGEIRFEVRGCALCLGAASILTELAAGRPLSDLQALTSEHFLAQLQSPVRPARLRCALLPWLAFRRAVFGEAEEPI